MTMVYVLCMAMRQDDGTDTDWDVFGIYSTRELAEKAREWRRRDDGLYQGVQPNNVYNKCIIDTRIIDYNLPK